MMAVLAAVLSLAGFACLALSMPRHHRNATKRAALMLRIAGCIAIGAAFALCATSWGLWIGLSVGFGISSAMGLITVLALTYVIGPNTSRA